MKAIEFPEVNVRFAENQDEYQTMPAYKAGGALGEVTVCFELNEQERKQAGA